MEKLTRIQSDLETNHVQRINKFKKKESRIGMNHNPKPLDDFSPGK